MFSAQWGRTLLLVTILSSLAVSSNAERPGKQDAIDRTINIGQPKIWRYERVYPLLDGMLRDIEAALVQHLPLLDPNAANEAYMDFLRTLIGVQVDYSQGAGVKNQLEQAKAQQAAKQQQLDNEYLNTLRQQRIETSKQLLAAEQQQTVAQQRLNTAKVGTPEHDDAQKEVDRQTQLVNDLQARKKQLDTDIGQSGQTSVNFTDTLSGDTAKTQSSSIPQFLDTVPENVKSKIWEKLDKADLPASKQFENYVVLLNERLAKQLMVIADDASRSGYQLFMMQFDVGLYPTKKTKNRVARVEFQMSGDAPSHRQPYAYGLIPGTSAYNIQQYIGRSKNLSFVGLFNLLSGLGVRGEYQRQRDQFRTGLTQTVYTSGFENGQKSFGWYHGPAPFENFVTPGLRTTYALVAVPDCTAHLTFVIQKGWQRKSGDLDGRPPGSETYTVDVPGYDSSECKGATDPHPPSLNLTQIAYQTKPYQSASNSGQSSDSSKINPNPTDTNTIVLVLKNPADANMTVTAGGKLLKRVRDTRGQAVLTGAAATPPRGEFEIDQFGPNTWILSNSRTVLINISKDTAGDEFFPLIRLSDSSTTAADIISLLEPSAEIAINDRKLKTMATAPIPRTAFIPLFERPECDGNTYLHVSVDQAERPTKVRLSFRPPEADDLSTDISAKAPQPERCAKGHRLGEATQVILDAGQNGQWALSCKRTGEDLVCDVPSQACGNLHVIDAKPGENVLNIVVSNCIDDQSIFVYEPTSGIKASARFESPEVLPHFERIFSPVSYDGTKRAWIVTPKGIHISPGDTRIRELLGCGNDEDVPYSMLPTVSPNLAENSLKITIPTTFYEHCMSQNPTDPYHLLHSARRSSFGRGFDENQTRDIEVELENLSWDIRWEAISSMSISKLGESYKISRAGNVRPFHAKWVDSLLVRNGPGVLQPLEFTKASDDILLFASTDKIKTSSVLFFYVRIGDATLPLEDSSGNLLCYDFKKEKLGCENSAAAQVTK